MSNNDIGSKVLFELPKNTVPSSEKVVDTVIGRRKNFYLRNGFHSTGIFLSD